MLNHPFPPVYDENARVLILGSFPSVKSREQGFFYGHPQNRFWWSWRRSSGTPFPKRCRNAEPFCCAGASPSGT